MHPITQALLAVTSADHGDTATAQAQIAAAQRLVRRTGRRDRQIVAIAALVVAWNRARAAGLAWEHTAEFPDDVALLASVADTSGNPT